MSTCDQTTSALDLEQYRQERKLTYRALADLIGVPQAKQARAYALGLQWPRDPSILDHIVAQTGGLVTVEAMHRRRVRVETQVA